MAKGNFDVAGRIGASKTAAPSPVTSPDAILFAAATPAATAAEPETDEEILVRFGSQLPAGDLITVHRLAYWQRVPLYEVLSAAIRAYGPSQPEAAMALPEKERAARKLPRG